MNIYLDMDYNGKMETFADHKLAKDNAAEKFLVTAGYTSLQKSKIRQLEIEQDFKEIFMNDIILKKIDSFLNIGKRQKLFYARLFI